MNPIITSERTDQDDNIGMILESDLILSEATITKI